MNYALSLIVSIAVIKYPDNRQFRGERGFSLEITKGKSRQEPEAGHTIHR